MSTSGFKFIFIFNLFVLFLVEALTFPPTSGKSFIMGPDEAMESELGLGELAGLTVANEADSLAYDVSSKRQTGFLNVMGPFLQGKHFLVMLASSLVKNHPTSPL